MHSFDQAEPTRQILVTMAEDGLLLNLAIPGAPIPVSLDHNSIKGKWTQRLKAKRAIQRSAKKPVGSSRAQSSSSQSSRNAANSEAQNPRWTDKGSRSIGTLVERNFLSPGRAFARNDEDSSAEPRGRSSRGANNVPSSATQLQYSNQGSSMPSHIISSLFTSNPSTERASASEDGRQQEDPSNAPLIDDTSFKGLGLHISLVSHVQEKMNFGHPTAVQRAAVPALISSNPQDLFIQAQTGSGKTLAYVLPIIHALMNSPETLTRESGLFAIIIAPTRELASQIYSVLESVVRCCHYIVPGIVIGGEKKKSEKARLRKGVNILVSTPGRLADHFDNTEALDLSAVRWVILDEGDRLMELGFEQTITKILSKIEEKSRAHIDSISGLPNRRVTVLCSATLKEGVEQLGKQSLSNAVHINVDSRNPKKQSAQTSEKNEFSAPDQLHQEYVVVPMKLRLVSLIGTIINIIQSQNNAKIMIFLSCSDSVNFHFSMLTRDGTLGDGLEGEPEATDADDEGTSLPSHILKAYLKTTTPLIHKLHGSLSQSVRKSTLASFTKAIAGPSVLLCTDVASRGLDLPSISHVVEFDPPFALEDHLHRVGRTARVGNEGWSTIFVLPGKEEYYIDNVLARLHKSPPIRRDYSAMLSSAFGGKLVWQDIATNAQLDVERWLLQSHSNLSLSKAAFTSHVRAYTTHLSSERQYFSVRELHLGHLAKSFGLREPPAALGRASNASPSNQASGEFRKKRPQEQGPDYAKRKMLKIAQMHAGIGASEFNLG
ncbi:P-loop containing nucleoside triphosphate hydrolase protein [Lipomyces tetrasporus]|uniref:ATP-dependent RNA helicase n=1 Tax=Lipomyces tetrasporus TaxID=54092 RepID=A0AAD7QKH9_9ASCO|nr:P-loop containing nucleoside triphosphate hydrolase protein [Lipomyces tetrasporus]KAJ8096570.1 P-loop containing nucleoside triphosphate hydrolase protein [Lipomyces tetrasporus]